MMLSRVYREEYVFFVSDQSGWTRPNANGFTCLEVSWYFAAVQLHSSSLVYGLMPQMQETITRTNQDRDTWCHMTPQGNDGLIWYTIYTCVRVDYRLSSYTVLIMLCIVIIFERFRQHSWNFIYPYINTSRKIRSSRMSFVSQLMHRCHISTLLMLPIRVNAALGFTLQPSPVGDCFAIEE